MQLDLKNRKNNVLKYNKKIKNESSKGEELNE